ncbi:MAG: pilus assembly protein PilM [Candidatus Auribacterota bacterium]|nr:pilus assembly protein PilM [Candidatus Auribacterota bacterium]
MPEEKKKAGLQKDISSIFSGLEDIDNGREDRKSAPPTADKPAHSGPIPPLPVPAEKAVKTGSGPPLSIPKNGLLIKGGSFPKRRNSFLGLDIGVNSIKLVQLYPVSGGWEIGGYALQEFPPAADGKYLSDSENFARRLKNLFANVGAPKDGIICSLRGDEVKTSLAQLAGMPKAELVSAIRLETGRRVDFNIDKALIQHIVLEKDSGRRGGKLNYVVTAAGRDTVNKILSNLREAGLQLVSLLPLPFAWKNFLQDIVGVEPSIAVAIVDVGSRHTRVSIYKDVSLHFSRDFETAGDDISEAIVQAGRTFGVKTEISREVAEKIKKTTDFFQSDSSQALMDNLTVTQVAGMVRPVLEKIVQESNRSLEYFRQLYRREEVSLVYLCGGGALLPGIEHFFKERMRHPVEIIDSLDKIKFHSSISSNEEIKKLFPRLARAAALSASRKWEVNFIPSFDRILQNILRRKLLILIPVILLLGISILFYQPKTAMISQEKEIIANKQQQLKSLKEGLAPYNVLSGLQKQLNAREKVGLYSSLRQPNWKGILKEFSRITPPTIILSRINSLDEPGPHRILCSGRVLERESSLHSGVTPFVVRVENSPFFKDVEKIYEDIERGTFSFRCTLIY